MHTQSRTPPPCTQIQTQAHIYFGSVSHTLACKHTHTPGSTHHACIHTDVHRDTPQGTHPMNTHRFIQIHTPLHGEHHTNMYTHTPGNSTHRDTTCTHHEDNELDRGRVNGLFSCHSRPSPKFRVKAPWSSQAPSSLQPAKGPCHLHVGTHRHHDPCSPTMTGRRSAGGLPLYTHSNTRTRTTHSRPLCGCPAARAYTWSARALLPDPSYWGWQHLEQTSGSPNTLVTQSCEGGAAEGKYPWGPPGAGQLRCGRGERCCASVSPSVMGIESCGGSMS